MRLRFAVSGHAPKAEAKSPAPDAKPQVDATKAPSGGTNEAATATNDQAKTEAATGS
jgi:two-component system nitrogen regulation sensor histidine kinase NtrY